MGVTVNGIYEPAIGETGWGALVSADLEHVGNAIDLWDNLSAAGYDPASGTDAAAGLQAIIDSVPTTGSAGVPAHSIYVPGHFRLDSQVNIYQKAIRFLGRGVGNPTNFSTPGEGSGFRWAGSAGANMFNVRDSKWVGFSDLFFQGNTTNVPAALVYFENAGGVVGTNEQLFLDRCQIGSLAWSTPGTSGGTSATVGVRFGGTNGNNDQFHLRDCVFERTATGISLDNTQSIWGLLTNTLFNTCATAGLTTSSSVQLTNATFNACGLDLDINSTARVLVHGWWSEGSAQFADLSGQGYLGVWGGLINNTASTAGTNAINHALCAGNTGGLFLSGLRVNQAGLTHAKIKARGSATGTGRGAVSILDCIGWDFADLDIANVTSGDSLDVNIISNGMNISRTLAGGGSPETLTLVGRFSGTGAPENVVTANIGSLYQRLDGGVSTSLYVKTSGTGNTGWTAK